MESLRPRRLSEFIEVLWRRKKLLVLMTAAMMIATTFVIRRIPNLYESRALIVVSLRSEGQDEQSDKQLSRFSALQQELKSRATIAALLRKYNLYPKAASLEDAITTLDNFINVETKMRGYYPETPESVSIRYRHTDPGATHKVVSDLVGIFEQANEQIKHDAGGEAERLTAQIAEVEQQLIRIGPQRDLDSLRSDYLNRSRIESNSNRTNYQALQSTIETLRTKEFSLEGQIADQRRLIAEQQVLVKAVPTTPGATNSAAYGQLLSERTRIEADIKFYSDQYTEKHPKIVQLRSQLAEINRQITRLEASTDPAVASTMSPEARELRQMQRELTNLERELSVVRHEIGKKSESLIRMPSGGGSTAIPLPRTTNAATRTEYERLLSRYNWLRDKQDAMLKISGTQGVAGMMFKVIDAPNLPQLPVAPNRILLQALALGLSLGFGLAIAFAVELPKMFMINDERDIEYYLGAPVLALIPETLTPIERSRRRKLGMTRGLLILMLAAVLVPAFIFLLNRLQIFQTLGNK